MAVPLVAGPLVRGRLIRRYQRFLADVARDDGVTLTVHCPNPGRMTSCAVAGAPVLLSVSPRPGRKYGHTLEMIEVDGTWVGVHPARANAIVRRLVERGAIAALRGYDTVRAEVPFGPRGRSRADLRLEAGSRRPCWVEVKSTTFRVPGRRRYAAFPDAPTARGRRHLEDLDAAVTAGDRAVLFFQVARSDVARFRPADEVDPAYGAALRAAVARGVEVLAYRMRYGPDGVELAGRLEVDLAAPRS